MGGSSSKAKAAATTLNNTMLSIATSTIQNCSAIASQDQLINLRGNTGTINMSGSTISQGSTVNLSCALSLNNKQQIASNISSMLNNTVAASASTMSGTSRATTSGNITNTVSSAVSNLTEQNLTSLISQRQTIDASNNSGTILMKNMTISQSATIVAQGIVDAINATGITSDIANAITNSSTAESTNPLDTFMSTLGQYAVYIFIFILIVAIAIGGYFLYGMLGDDAPSDIEIVATPYYPDQRMYFE